MGSQKRTSVSLGWQVCSPPPSKRNRFEILTKSDDDNLSLDIPTVETDTATPIPATSTIQTGQTQNGVPGSNAGWGSSSLESFFSQYIDLSIPPVVWQEAMRVNVQSLQAIEAEMEGNRRSLTALDASIAFEEKRLTIETTNLRAFDQLRKKLSEAKAEYEAAEDVSRGTLRIIQSLPKVALGKQDKLRHVREELRKLLREENEMAHDKGLAARSIRIQWTCAGGEWAEAGVSQCRSRLKELQQRRNDLREAGEELGRQRKMRCEAIDFLSLVEGDPSRAVVIMDLD